MARECAQRGLSVPERKISYENGLNGGNASLCHPMAILGGLTRRTEFQLGRQSTKLTEELDRLHGSGDMEVRHKSAVQSGRHRWGS